MPVFPSKHPKIKLRFQCLMYDHIVGLSPVLCSPALISSWPKRAKLWRELGAAAVASYELYGK
jgi:hypothetical protein